MQDRFSVLLALLRGRVLLSAAGLAMLVVGVIVAWRTEAATALLIVGGVLATLGLLDWRAVRVSHEGTAVEVIRAEDRIEEALENPELPEEFRADLQEAVDDLRAARAADDTGYSATHKDAGPGLIELHLTTSFHALYSLKCEVKHVGSETAWRRSVPVGLAWTHAATTFPSDFDAEDAPDGLYNVVWTARALITGDRDTARDRFRYERARAPVAEDSSR